MTVIHAHVFDPTRPSLFVKRKASDHAEYHTVTCAASERCELFARKQCVARQFMGSGCPFGSAARETGPTQRARNFYTWISERQKTSNEIGYLDAPPDRLARVADFIWLPYSFMDVALAGLKHPNRFVPIEAFTAELVARLCEARPRGSWYDVELHDYQRKSVPAFVAHLSESYPDLLREAAPLSDRIRAILPTLTKVGRKARLHTLRPGVGTFEGGWRWDGSHMVTTSRRDFPPFTKFDAQELRIQPGKDAVVTITDDGQVSPETVFED